jgi:uncharacterized damage-inducible protein DinB
MSLHQLINSNLAYNFWANEQFAGWLSTLDESILYAKADSSYGSIDLTVQHILCVERFWSTFIHEEDIVNFDWSVFENQAAQNLTDLKEQSLRMKQSIGNFDESQLNKILPLDTPWSKNNQARFHYIFHMLNHSTYHRGQIVTMARQLGVTEGIPGTDYNFFTKK